MDVCSRTHHSPRCCSFSSMAGPASLTLCSQPSPYMPLSLQLLHSYYLASHCSGSLVTLEAASFSFCLVWVSDHRGLCISVFVISILTNLLVYQQEKLGSLFSKLHILALAW